MRMIRAQNLKEKGQKERKNKPNRNPCKRSGFVQISSHIREIERERELSVAFSELQRIAILGQKQRRQRERERGGGDGDMVVVEREREY